MIKLKNKIIKEDIERIHKENIPWSQMQGKIFLISGAAGMISTYMVHTILELNKKKSKKSIVYALVKNKKEAEEKFIKYSNDKCLKIIRQDVSKKFNLDKKINYIIHAASKASPKYYKEDPVNTLLPNVMGTNNLLELGIKHKIDGFLFLSSGEIYGDMKKRKILEDSVGKINPLELRSCYAESKRMGENMCVSWNKQFNVPTKIARI